MDNAFIQNKIDFRKKTPVDVFKMFFFVKSDPVYPTFYDGSVQLITHSSLWGFPWHNLPANLVNDMDNAFFKKKMHFRKKAPVDVFKVFFHVKRDPVRRTFYDGNVQLIKHYFL